MDSPAGPPNHLWIKISVFYECTYATVCSVSLRPHCGLIVEHLYLSVHPSNPPIFFPTFHPPREPLTSSKRWESRFSLPSWTSSRTPIPMGRDVRELKKGRKKRMRWWRRKSFCFSLPHTQSASFLSFSSSLSTENFISLKISLGRAGFGDEKDPIC